MIASESINTVINLFNPKRSPYYSVFLLLSVCMIATSQVSIVLAPYTLLIILPIFLFTYLLCFIRPTEILTEETEEIDRKHLFEHKVLGVACGAISLMIAMNSKKLISFSDGILLFSKEFIEIYIGVFIVTYYFFFLGSIAKIFIKTKKANAINELHLLTAILLISMTIVAKDVSDTNAALVYYAFLRIVFWFNIVMHFLNYNSKIILKKI